MSTKKGRASPLAVPDAKRTLDYLSPIGVTYRLPSSTTLTSTKTISPTSSSADGASTRDQLKSLRASLSPGSMSEYPMTLFRGLERTHIADPALATIHENEEPHPGRRIRISSGYAIESGHAIGSHHRARDLGSAGSISPLTLSDSISDYDEVSLSPKASHRRPQKLELTNPSG